MTAICGIVILSAVGLDARPLTNNVAVIVGNNAPDLENFAASELCGYLDKLFGIQVQPATKLSGSSDAIFLDRIAGHKSADQGISASQRSRHCDPARARQDPTLIVGGGSPKATMWAVYELAERWGVHFLNRSRRLARRNRHSACLI